MKRTLLSDLEQLIRFPSDHTSSKSAPAPFHNTAKNLEDLIEVDSAWNLEHTRGSIKRSS